MRIMTFIAIAIGATIIIIISLLTLKNTIGECVEHTVYRQYSDFSEPIQEIIYYSEDKDEIADKVHVYITGQVDGEVVVKYDYSYETIENASWNWSFTISGAVDDTSGSDLYSDELAFVMLPDSNETVEGSLDVTFKFYPVYGDEKYCL